MILIILFIRERERDGKGTKGSDRGSIQDEPGQVGAPSVHWAKTRRKGIAMESEGEEEEGENVRGGPETRINCPVVTPALPPGDGFDGVEPVAPSSFFLI